MCVEGVGLKSWFGCDTLDGKRPAILSLDMPRQTWFQNRRLLNVRKMGSEELEEVQVTGHVYHILPYKDPMTRAIV